MEGYIADQAGTCVRAATLYSVVSQFAKPSSEPYTGEVFDYSRPFDSVSDESDRQSDDLCMNRPTSSGLQSPASPGEEEVHHHRKRADTSEFPWLAPSFQASRLPALCDYFLHAKCRSGAVPYAFRYHPATASSVPLMLATDHRRSCPSLLLLQLPILTCGVPVSEFYHFKNSRTAFRRHSRFANDAGTP